MDATTMIRERRSIRDFIDKKVDIEIINEIIADAIFSPSWANTQSVRYTIVNDEKKVKEIANTAFGSFEHNSKITNKAAGVVIISCIKNKSGCGPNGKYITNKGDAWEMFDAGIASQTFCLSAYEKGIGTVIFGFFDEEKISKIINLPDNQTIATVIPYGYEQTHPKPVKRLSVSEVTRYI